MSVKSILVSLRKGEFASEVLLGCNDLSSELASSVAGGRADAFCREVGSPHRLISRACHAHDKAAVDTEAFSSMSEGLLVEAHEPI
jgi:hypothetical protein